MPFVIDTALDATLDYIADNGTRLDICDTEPATYAAATSTNTLGNVTLTAGDGNGDYTVEDGDVDGRKLTVAAQVITGTGAGSQAAWAITDGTSELIATGLCSGPDVSVSATVNVASFAVRIPDAVTTP